MNLTEKIKSYIYSNIVPNRKRTIGVEIEGLYYDNYLKRLPVNPSNKYSAADLLNDIKQLNDSDSLFNYSLEPGGQLEWASGPTISLWDIKKQLDNHLKLENRVCEANKINRLYLSVEPIYKPQDIDLIRSKKYESMDKVFQKTGSMGSWMMRNTTSVQVNIDFTSKQDANEMAFIADVIQPLFSMLFSNAPFINGQAAKTDNLRWKIWENTDNNRCRSLFDHDIYIPKSMVNNYAKWIQSVPAIFEINNSSARSFSGSLVEMLSKHSDDLDQHILSALRQSFTHVRYKKVLEIRAADRPIKGNEMCPPAFLAGLLTAQNVREELLEIITKWSKNDRKKLIILANNLSLDKTGPQGKSIQEWLEILADLSLRGLDERSVYFNIKNERSLLEPYLINLINNGPSTLQIQKKFQKTKFSLDSFLLELT